MNRFEAGRRFKSRGQSFEIAGLKDHWTRDDRYIEMVRYKSVCAHPACRRIFEAMTTKTRLRSGQLNKRCRLHHAPGMPAPVRKPRPKPKPQKRPRSYVIAQLLLRNVEAIKRTGRPSYLD